MALRVVSAAFLAAGVIACTPVPKYQTDGRIKPADVVKRIQCEIRLTDEKSREAKLKLSDYKFGFTLALKAETELGANVKAGDWIIPYHLTDTFSAGLAAGVNDTVLRDGSITSDIKLENLKAGDCPHEFRYAYSEDPAEAERKYGSFGIISWFDQMTDTVSQTGSKAEPNKMDYTVRFAVTANATASPGFKVINMSGVLNLPTKRTDTHTLTLAFVKKKEDKIPDPIDVCIINLGSEPCDEKKLMTNQKQRSRSSEPQVQQELNQYLDTLRLRDILRP